MKKPRILYITPCWPLGQSYGTQLRVLHVGRALREVGEVSLAVVGFYDPEKGVLEKTAEEFRIVGFGKLQPAVRLSYGQRVRCALDPRFLGVFNSGVDEALRSTVLQNLSTYDLIWLNHLHVPYRFRLWHWPRSIMDLDDVPSTFERTILQRGGPLRERLSAAWRMFAWRRREKLLPERFSGLAVCSEADREYLGLSGRMPVHVIPNGFEKPSGEPPRAPADPPRIGFIGVFGYPPNQEGIRWFLNECWPRIRRDVPQVRLRLAGKGSDEMAKGAGPDVDGLGWIANSEEEIATWSAMIIPIRLGAGTRIKVAEAFSRKCPLVSTRVGAFGYAVEDGRELLLADSPDEFARACVRLIRHQEEAKAMADRAWRRFLENWTWDAIRPKVAAAAEDCLRRSAQLQLSGVASLK